MAKSVKNIVFSLLLAGFVVGIFELAGGLMLRRLNGEWMTRSAVLRAYPVEDIAANEPAQNGLLRASTRVPDYLQQHTLHPYIGFCRNPENQKHSFVDRIVPYSVNEFGFFGESPLVRPEDGVWNVYLLGGSVALEFFIDAKERFERLLAESPLCEGRDVRLFSLSLGGMKQPQQVIQLNYLLALGAMPDMVLCLDGFNEVVLPLVENVAQGVYPFYPRKWNVYGSTTLDIEAAAMLGSIAEHRAALAASAAFIHGSPLRHSRVGLALWQRKHGALEARRLDTEQRLQDHLARRAEALPFRARGPAYPARSKEAMSADCVDVWANASRQMWMTCAANGIAFMQFLQPNQYVAGSKVFTEWEQGNAIGDPLYVWRLAAELGYPGLMARGRELADEGMPFVDLTPVYADVPESIYKDICCHVNERGSEILAERMVEALRHMP